MRLKEMSQPLHIILKRSIYHNKGLLVLGRLRQISVTQAFFFAFSFLIFLFLCSYIFPCFFFSEWELTPSERSNLHGAKNLSINYRSVSYVSLRMLTIRAELAVCAAGDILTLRNPD